MFVIVKLIKDTFSGSPLDLLDVCQADTIHDFQSCHIAVLFAPRNFIAVDVVFSLRD